jgi:DnaJ homolog subfamily B member 4
VQESLKIQLKPFFDTKSVLRFIEKGHEAHGARRSDVVITFLEIPSACGFVRDGCDLVYIHKLSLAEAMSPCTLSVKTLDGRSVSVSPGEYVT